MGKQQRATTVVGIDVSKDCLDVSVQRGGGQVQDGQFANALPQWRTLLRWMRQGATPVRVVLEATGVYHLDLAVFLQAQKKVEVMVVNPQAAHNFAQACMQRAKTDRVTAGMLREFAARMVFVPWQPPRREVLQVRTLARRVEALKQQRAAEKNRLHAAQSSALTPAAVRADIQANLDQLEQRITALSAAAVRQIESDPDMRQRYEQLLSVTGVAAASAVQLLAELLVLPPDMTVRQWVAHCGLDPRPFESGSSVQRPVRISKQGNARLRAALYFPALTAMQHDPHVQAFADQLRARQCAGLQVVVAVMRKLLHAIFGMWKHASPWCGEKFFALHSARAAAVQPATGDTMDEVRNLKPPSPRAAVSAPSRVPCP